MHLLFAYGSLICEDIMFAVAGPCQSVAEASLRDYRRLVVRNQHYPGMIEAPGYSVQGRVYRGISVAGWQRLDRFEGEMYQRRPVQVVLTAGARVSAFSYIIKDAYRDQLEPRDWQFDDFLDQGKQAFVASYLGFRRIPNKS